MIENIIFDFSGLVQDKSNKEEIEFWGHDAGEFVTEEAEKLQESVEVKKEPEDK